MRSLNLVAALALLTGCSEQKVDEREALMNKIEAQVKLPDGAKALNEYARYYVQRANGEVAAVYLIPFYDLAQSDERCEEILENFATRAVDCGPTKPDWLISAGERRWVKDERELPFMSDGGCGQVTVIFNQARSAITSVRCNISLAS